MSISDINNLWIGCACCEVGAPFAPVVDYLERYIIYINLTQTVEPSMCFLPELAQG
jgi:hypothetical protein